MLDLTRWTPFAELGSLHRDLDSLFGRVFGQSPRGVAGAFTPAAEVRREGDDWNVSVALPGIAPDKVDIEITGRTLKIRGERIVDAGQEQPETVFSEIAYGRFEREFMLPEEIDAEHAQARYRHGMLELTLPLKESARPRRITVQAGSDVKRLHAA